MPLERSLFYVNIREQQRTVAFHVIVFAMAPVEGLLEGNSFIVRGEVTSGEATNKSTCCWEEKNTDVKMISYLRGM